MIMNTFENLIEPLDKQHRIVLNKKTNTQEPIQAIDRIFMEEKQMLPYLPPPLSILNDFEQKNQAIVDEYIERLKFIEIDLKWALSLDYQHFWCQIIYDKSFKLLIDSYLKYAPRPHDVFKLNNVPTQVLTIHDSIQKLVFLVCLRMSTYKESKENFLSQEAFANIIYNNYLFDIPKIIDICVLYRKNEILPKMIGNLFKTQEKYFNDFKVCVKDIFKTFDSSRTQLVKLFDLDAMYGVKERKESPGERIKSDFKKIIETIYYLTDFAFSFNDFISVLPTIGEILYENEFEHRIKELFENTIFNIEDKLHKLKKESSDSNLNQSIAVIKSKLKLLKFQLAKLFKKIFEACSITPILKGVDSEEKSTQKHRHYFDVFIKICSHMLEYERFLCYYEEKFKLSESIDIVVQFSDNEIDESQQKYLIDSLKSCILNHSKKKSLKSKFVDYQPKVNTYQDQDDEPAVTPKHTKTQPSTSKASHESNTLQDLAVKSVLDLFPDFDTDLIKKCLKYFNNNIEEVINALLENNIPEFPPDASFSSSKQNYKEDELCLDYDNDQDDYEMLNLNSNLSDLTLRKNIYDGDEFDIFKKDTIDKSKVVLGKKNTTDTFDLDDKADLNRDFYKNYDAIMYQRQEKYGENPEEYEDEYDDTYDANTNTIELNLEPESFIKPLNQKLGIKKRDQFEDDDEDDEEEEEENNDQKPSTSVQAIGTSHFRNQQKNSSFSNQIKSNYGNNEVGQNRQPENKRFDKNQQQQQHQQQQQQFQKLPQRQQTQRNNRNENYNSNNQFNSSSNNNIRQQMPQYRNQNNYDEDDDRNDNRRNMNKSQLQNTTQSSDREWNSNQAQGGIRNNQSNLNKQQPQPQRNQQNKQSNDQQRTRNQRRQDDQEWMDEEHKNSEQMNRNSQLNKPLPQRQNSHNKQPNDQQKNQASNYQDEAERPVVKTEEEIKRERKWKNENKAKTVHHNRKELAAKKMNFF